MPNYHQEQLFARDRHPESRDITLNPETAPAQSPPPLQMKASKLGEEESAVIQQKEENQRQHAEKPGANPPPFTPPAENPVDQRGAGAGAGTGGKLMGKMEAAFGTSFSDVKIHQNSQQAETIQAKAFAKGNEVHFAPGQYNPESQSGQELMGHELAHVVQQRQGRVQANAVHAKGLAVNDDKGLENEADQMGRMAAAGQKVSVRMLGTSAGAGANVVQGAFTSSVSLTRKLKEDEVSQKVKADSVKVSAISIPEKKRQDTRHIGKKQGHHSLAWTFLVKSYQTLGSQKLKLSELLEQHLIPDYQDLKKQLSYSGMGGAIDEKLLDTMKKDSRSPGEWKTLLANLMQNYLRLHQLAPFSTAEKTFAKPGGEAAIKSNLNYYEGIDIQKDLPGKVGEDQEIASVDEVLKEMSGALEDLEILLMDDVFRANPEIALQFLKKEWLTTMQRAYPTLWKKMQNADSALSKTIDTFFVDHYIMGSLQRLKVLKPSQEHKKGAAALEDHTTENKGEPPTGKRNSRRNTPYDKDEAKSEISKEMEKIVPNYTKNLTDQNDKNVPTGKDLVKTAGNKLGTIPVLDLVKGIVAVAEDQKKKSTYKAKDSNEEEEIKEEDFFKELDSQYNVGVSIREENGPKSKIGAYKIGAVMMGNERPDTQYGTVQKSHTVAWAIIRESFETLGQGEQTLIEFLETIQKDSLKLLDALVEINRMANDAKKDISGDVKKPLVQVAKEIEDYIKAPDEEKTDGEWEDISSDLLTRYLSAMHQAPTTTFGKKPGGRGEGTAMGKLSGFENILSGFGDENDKKPVWKDIEPHLNTMIDLDKGKFFEGFLDKPFVYVVYEWETHIKRAFPKVYKSFENDIKDLSESKLDAVDSIEGYKSPKVYLHELRSGSKFQDYKNNFLKKEEDKDEELEENENSDQQVENQSSQFEWIEDQDIEENTPTIDNSSLKNSNQNSLSFEGNFFSQNSLDIKEDENENSSLFTKKQKIESQKGKSSPPNSQQKRTNEQLLLMGINPSFSQGDNRKPLKSRKKEKEEGKKLSKIKQIQSSNFTFNPNQNSDKDGNGGGSIELEE